MSIQAIYFDLGGVIVRTEDKSSRTNLAAEFGMSYADMDSFVFESQAAALASIGKLTEEQHWLDVTRRLNCPVADMPRIRDAFFSGDGIDQALVDMLRSLRRTHKTGLISNAWDGLRPWIIDRKFEDAFDAMTISSEVGFAKPDARIYQFALEKLGVEPAQAVFVDDIEENVAGAQALGMQGLLFQSSGQTLADLKQLLDM